MNPITGKRLRELREERELKQEDVARVIGVTPEAVGNYENCKREPKGEILAHLADFFGVSVDYLLGRTDNREGIKQNIDKEAQLLFGRINRLNKAGKEQIMKALDWIEEIEARERKMRESQSRGNKKS